MKLKRSDFVLSTLDKNEDLLLFNTLNRKYIRILSEQKDRFQEFIKMPEIEKDESNEFVTKLYEMGFLIEREFDEEWVIEDSYIRTCHSNDVLILTILPTEKCNFKCIYCYESFAKGKMDLQTQEAVISFVRKELKKYRSLEISWFGGEPLLAMDVIENLSTQFIKICKEQKKHYFANITTNAYLLTADVFRKLLYLNVLRYQITVDVIKEIHDKQRVLLDGSGTFDKIINNLKDIRDNIPSRLFRITIRSNLLATAENEIVRKYYEFYKKEFGHDNRFLTKYYKVWIANENKEIENQLYPQKDFEELLKIGKENEDNNKIFDEIGTGVYPCYAAKRNSYVIGSDAELYKCTVAFQNELNNIGKIDEKGNAHIDNKKQLLFNNIGSYRKKLCNKCPLLPRCLRVKCPISQNGGNTCKDLINSNKKKMILCSDMAQKIEIV